MQAVICPVCKGEGQICTAVIEGSTLAIPILKPCHGCKGNGWVVIPEVILYKPPVQPKA